MIRIGHEEGDARRVPEGLLEDGLGNVVAAPGRSEPRDEEVVPGKLGGVRLPRLRRVLEPPREFHRVGLRVERLERVLEDLGLHPARGRRE